MVDTEEQPHVPSPQSYLSTRGGDDKLSFETVVLKGLAADGGLFLPEEVPANVDWQSWKDLSYPDLALQVLSLFVSTDEIPTADLKDIVDRSYSTFRAKDVTPLCPTENNPYILELFHGPSYSFKDCALQFLGNLFEYFLTRKNKGKTGTDRHHLTVVGATSGDTGSAAIYGLRNKKDVSVFILHPKGRISEIQEKQMTTVLDANVHNIAIDGSFDDCQDLVKTLFGDAATNRGVNLGAVNSINWARILAQIVYYFYSYFSLARQNPDFKVGDQVRFAVPTGNFGDVLAGYFATRMGLPAEKLVIATNENDILDRFWKTGKYEKKPAKGPDAEGGLPADGVKAHEDGVRETLSPAMDILVSSNFERLLWFLAYEFASSAGMGDEWNKKQASQEVAAWLSDLKKHGGFGPVYVDVLKSANRTFASERVSDAQTLETMKATFKKSGYVLDPHTAVGVTAANRSLANSSVPHISLSTAHPAKFSNAVKEALGDAFEFDDTMPKELKEMWGMETRVQSLPNDWEKLRALVLGQAEADLKEGV